MRLVILEKGARVGELRCGEEAVYIGSEPDCEIRLTQPQIAARLGVIYAEDDGAWAFEQLEPQAPIQLNGGPVKGKVQLKSGDQLKIHEYLIRVEADRQAAPTRPTPSPVRRTSVARMTRFVQYQLPPGAVIRKLDEPLTVRPEHLAQAARANVGFAQCSTVEELMDAALKLLLNAFGGYRVWMGVRRVNYGPMEYVEGRLPTGQTTELPPTGENLKPRVLDRGQFVLLPRGDEADPRSVLAGPLPGPEGPLGLVFIDSADRCYDGHDLDFFILLMNLLAAQLDAIFQQIARTRAAMLEGEVAVAHAIQTRLTPRKLPQWPELQFGAFREMGRERTSDIYDIIRLSNQMAAFMIAHTSATGPFPGLLMAQAQAAFRTAAMHLDGPHVFLRSLSRLIYDGTREHPLDCFAGVIDPATGEMRYARAGQIGAYIISNRGEERSLGADDPTPSLGLVKNANYTLRPERLGVGETLVLFTPGVVTARNARGEVFGEERFVNILCDGFAQLASNMLKEMLHDLRQFTEAGSQPDDITVILAHRV